MAPGSGNVDDSATGNCNPRNVYFNHGFLLKEQEKEIAAKRCFEKCMIYIESYIDSKNTNFDFLSEEFSAEYFYSLCKKYVLGGDEK